MSPSIARWLPAGLDLLWASDVRRCAEELYGPGIRTADPAREHPGRSARAQAARAISAAPDSNNPPSTPSPSDQEITIDDTDYDPTPPDRIQLATGAGPEYQRALSRYAARKAEIEQAVAAGKQTLTSAAPPAAPAAATPTRTGRSR